MGDGLLFRRRRWNQILAICCVIHKKSLIWRKNQPKNIIPKWKKNGRPVKVPHGILSWVWVILSMGWVILISMGVVVVTVALLRRRRIPWKMSPIVWIHCCRKKRMKKEDVSNEGDETTDRHTTQIPKEP